MIYSAQGTGHWNPDTLGDNGRWGHAFSWDPPERTHVSADGPILYRITRSGRMPGWNPEVELSVTYSFWADVPYVRMASSMRVTDDYGSLALRNGEMVFDAELFDAFAWKEKGGQIRKIRALHRPDPLIDAPATPRQKQVLQALSAEAITARELAGEPITGIYTQAPGNGQPIGGLKVSAENGWFAARPSGTEDIYKIYAESFKGKAHLARIQEEAQAIVDEALEEK